jgi:hypothetical protein
VVVDHDDEEGFHLMSRKEAFDFGLEIWKSQVVDENVRYLDFVSYHEGDAS